MYEVLIEKRALEDLDNFSEIQKNKILVKINKILTIVPYPKGKNPKHLKGNRGFRLRIGKIRIIYKIDNDKVFVYAIGLRKDVYKNLVASPQRHFFRRIS